MPVLQQAPTCWAIIVPRCPYLLDELNSAQAQFTVYLSTSIGNVGIRLCPVTEETARRRAITDHDLCLRQPVELSKISNCSGAESGPLHDGAWLPHTCVMIMWNSLIHQKLVQDTAQVMISEMQVSLVHAIDRRTLLISEST